MKPELLAPVGNMECLKAAINASCDAVYLAGKSFGARSFAGNFSNEELIEVIKISHLYGVKVYITVNTLVYESEVDTFLNYIDFIYKNNVDAVIMQDIGMIDLVRKTYPNLQIHASTQLHIHNLEGVKLCEELGLKRVVLAREIPIELIREIKKETNIELEVFIQGALCMCYSGQCLMSSLIGNRSGNRGTCAQSCRQPYDLIIDNEKVNKDKYLLSTKDLNILDDIGKLIDVGVKSLKIEGRMKRPEYVYLATSLYRKAIDNYMKFGKTMVTESDKDDLRKIFNRGFTKGFLFHEENDFFTNSFRPNHMGINIGEVLEYKRGQVKIKLLNNLRLNDGIRIISKDDVGIVISIMYKKGMRVDKANKGDIISIPIKEKVFKFDMVVKTTDYDQVKDILEKRKVDKKISINGSCILKVNHPITLSISDGINDVIITSDYIVECAQNNATTEDEIRTQLNKLGNTIYVFNKLIVDCNKGIFVSIKELNEIRRRAITLLNEKRIYKRTYAKEKYKINVNNYGLQCNRNVLIHTYEDYLENKNKYDIIYIDNELEFNKIEDNKCILKIPRVLEHFKDYRQRLLVGELGSVYKYRDIDTDFSLNIVNSYGVALLHSLGVNKITLSYELNYNQIKELIDNYKKRYNVNPNLEVIIKGYEEAMICKYNLLKYYNAKMGYLKDKFNNSFKIEIKDNLMYIYNYRKRDLKDDYFKIGINNVRVNL